ncbi:DUF1206 domain-containing protein [Pseudarthrobacter sp. Fe7]|nr:DUF1206 domain-containing protein [Pseudarthrobacter sp. Fe7]
MLARAGFVFIGLVHILIGTIALQLNRGQGGEADQSGAIGTLASQPGGGILLWAGAVACAALALWMLSEAVFGARTEPDAKKKLKEAGSAGGKPWCSVSWPSPSPSLPPAAARTPASRPAISPQS